MRMTTDDRVMAQMVVNEPQMRRIAIWDGVALICGGLSFVAANFFWRDYCDFDSFVYFERAISTGSYSGRLATSSGYGL